MKQHAFSLVELLFVMAVISVLAALLLPTMESALEQSRRIRCLSNMRQLYSQTMFYATDFSDMLPTPGSDVGCSIYWGAPGQIPAAADFAMYLGMTVTGATYHGMTAASRGLTQCPSQVLAPKASNYDYTFSGMGAHRWYSSPFGFSRFSRAAAPYQGKNKIFIVDNIIKSWCGNPGHTMEVFDYTNHLQNGTQAGGNVLMGDGGGIWHKSEDFYSTSCSFWPTTKTEWGQIRGNNYVWPYGTGGTITYRTPDGCTTPPNPNQLWGYR